MPTLLQVLRGSRALRWIFWRRRRAANEQHNLEQRVEYRPGRARVREIFRAYEEAMARADQDLMLQAQLNRQKLHTIVEEEEDEDDEAPS